MRTIPLHTYSFCIIYVDYREEENVSRIYYTEETIHTLEEAKVKEVRLTFLERLFKKTTLLKKTVDVSEEIEHSLRDAQLRYESQVITDG